MHMVETQSTPNLLVPVGPPLTQKYELGGYAVLIMAANIIHFPLIRLPQGSKLSS